MDEGKLKSPSDHMESARILLAEAPAELASLRAEYKQCVTNLTISPRFRVQTLSFLGHLRSALDFVAHDIAPICSRIPNRVYFPIAGRGVSRTEFETKLAKDWFPELGRNKPELYDYLVRLQHFTPGNEWLPAFHELSNSNKHVKLSKLVMSGCQAALIRLGGKPVMQIGDRGYQSVAIQDGGTLLFGSETNRSALRGPQTIDRNTKQLLNADAALDVVTATWSEFKFDEYPHQPAIVFLETAEREVQRICGRIEAFLQSQ